MTEKKKNNPDFLKDEKTNKYFSEIIPFFQNLPEEQYTTVVSLIQNACFIRATLDRLQEAIVSKDLTEAYQNGREQSGKKITSELQVYNSLIRNYTTIISKLLKLIPEKDRIEDSKLGSFFDAFNVD